MSLRAVARFFQKNIGWNRIGVLLSLAIIAVAAVVLFHMLRDIDVDEVIAALKATEPQHIVAAALFVAGGYFTLTFYDWFALRTIGRSEIPYRIAALVRLHQLFDRPQYRRHRVHRRRGALPHLFGLRPRRHRGGEDLLHRRPDLLARQRHRARARRVPFAARRRLRSISCRPGSTAASRSRSCWCSLAYVGWVWSAPREIGRGEWKVRSAERAVDAAADRHRHPRSRLLRARHVHAAAGRAEYRLRRRWRWCSCRRRCSALPATRPAGSACSTPPCWWRLWQFDKEDVLAGLLLFRLLYYLVAVRRLRWSFWARARSG